MEKITQEDIESKQYDICSEQYMEDKEFKAVIYRLSRYLIASGARYSYSTAHGQTIFENKANVVHQIKCGYLSIDVKANSKVHDKIVEIITN